jgi:PilZ domain
MSAWLEAFRKPSCCYRTGNCRRSTFGQCLLGQCTSVLWWNLMVGVNIGIDFTTTMERNSDPAQPPYFEARKYRRFSLRYSVQVMFDVGGYVSELHALSNNVSLGGILLEAPTPIPQHSEVSFTMIVPEHHIVGDVQLVGEGEVVRVEPHQAGTGFAIAVKCRRPLSKLEDYLSASVN